MTKIIIRMGASNNELSILEPSGDTRFNLSELDEKESLKMARIISGIRGWMPKRRKHKTRRN